MKSRDGDFWDEVDEAIESEEEMAHYVLEYKTLGVLQRRHGLRESLVRRGIRYLDSPSFTDIRVYKDLNGVITEIDISEELSLFKGIPCKHCGGNYSKPGHFFRNQGWRCDKEVTWDSLLKT
jgi:hypothetical protein